MAIDAATSQGLYDAMKGFITAGGNSPHSPLYEFGKDYQTLLAALVAFGAATLAYFGATAGVRESRRQGRLQTSTSRLGLFVRVRAAANSARSAAEYLKMQVDAWFAQLPTSIKSPDVPAETWMGWQANFGLATAAEFDEAWKSVEAFPLTAVNSLRSLTICSQQLGMLATSGVGKPADIAQASIARNALGQVATQAGNLVKILDLEIEQLGKAIAKSSA
ncbi:hypothetical protein ACMA5K_24250 [Bradyrhizobium diazoefficiens]|uniref:hypothetical protein n=1 Tax=Bradyrhizobium diazoefficiens TaxID=1355477 RepID=UPI000BEAA630|nr:hypothetical protein [Bradyrhizobium diazoefficiens]QLD43854.1 hypothetical protein HUW42_24030 [Bradyrhizobium diazoefficiens]